MKALQSFGALALTMALALIIGCSGTSNPLNTLKSPLTQKKAADRELNLQTAVELHPKSVAARLDLASFYIQERRWADAERQLRQTIQIEPRNPSPYAKLASLLQVEGRHDQAEEVLIRAKQVMADVHDGCSLLADFYFLTGDLPRALNECESLLRQYPSDELAQEADVHVLLAAGKLEEAAKSNNQLLNENPHDADALILRGQILTAPGQPEQALDCFRSVLKTANNLAYLLLEHDGDSESALALAEKARRLLPDSAITADTLAWAYIEKGVPQPAIDLLEQGVNSVPANPTYHYHLGIAFQKNHDVADARAHLERALGLKPEPAQQEQIREALAHINAS